MEKDYGLGISYRWLQEYEVIFQRSEEQRNPDTHTKRVTDGPKLWAVGEGESEVLSAPVEFVRSLQELRSVGTD